MREWLRLHIKLGCFLLIPALLILPLITFIVKEVVSLIMFVGGVVLTLILLPLAILIALIIGLFSLAVLKNLSGK